MVQITVKELGHKIERAHKGQNTPLLNGLCEDLALPALAKDTKERVKDLRTHIYNVVNEENYLTSLAVSQDDPGWIAMGSAQRKKDGKFYLYFILDVTAAQMVNETGPRFKLLRIEKLDIPIYSLDWSGPHLLVGSNHGLVRLYTLRQKEDKRPFVLAAEYKAPADQMAYMDGPLYVQGEYPMNSRIQRVQFAYNYSADYVYRRWQPLGDIPVPDRRDTPDVCSQFLSVFCNRVNIWDAVAEDAPSSSIKVHPSRLNCASWSPHAPCTLIVAGGCAKTLHIIDTRANRTVWTASEAHSRPIRDAKFSTFIPYWLASGGEDGVVNIFDIRATNHAAVAKISGHEGVIESISWSNMRPENLATTSADGTFRMWMLCKDAVPVSDTFYRARKWTKDDTPPAFLRPDERYIRQNWCGNAKDLIVPWAEAHPNYYYDDYDDPWGRSLDLEPQTMLLMGAIGVGGWGRTDKGPVYIGEDVEKSKGPVVEVRMSKTRLADYYCITTMGQLCVQSIRLEDRDTIKYQYIFDKDRDPIAHKIEYCLYVRKITQAREELQKLKDIVVEDEEKEIERQNQIAYFEERLMIRDAIQPNAWGFDTIPTETESKQRLWTPQDRWDLAVSVFQKDVEYWSRRLPPGYATHHHFDLDAQIDATVLSSASPLSDQEDLSNLTQLGIPVPPSSSPMLSYPIVDDGSIYQEEDLSPRLSVTTSRKSLSQLSTRSSTAGDGASGSFLSSHSGLPGVVGRTKSLRRIFSRSSIGSSTSTGTDEREQRESDTLITAPLPLTRRKSARRNAVFRPS